MASLLSFDPDHAYPLYYAVQKRLQGQGHSVDKKESLSGYGFVTSPMAQLMVAQNYASAAYESQSEKNADQLLKELADLDTEHLQNFIYRMKANILKMQHIHAMQHHHYNDAFPLCIDPKSALQGYADCAFLPRHVTECHGIDIICEDQRRKSELLASVNKHLKFTPKSRAIYLEHMSQVRSITEEDCKKDDLPDCMIGQKGVFARMDLPEDFFLGFYAGVYFDVLTDIVPFHDALGVGVELYLFGVQGQDVPFTSAYRFGNRISLVNSCTNYAGTATEIAHKLKYMRNCLPMRFKFDNSPNKTIRDNPNAFDMNGYVTTRPIKAGEQIFVDYGYNYWRNKTPDFTDATAEEIAAAMSEDSQI